MPTPHYIRPSQAGLLQWFTALADAATQPLIVYDIPYRTGVSIATETLRTLAGHPNIQAIKDCGGDARKTQALIKAALAQQGLLRGGLRAPMTGASPEATQRLLALLGNQ